MNEPEMNDPEESDLPWARKHKSGLWEDEYGILGPYRPGRKARSDPRGEFSTGPDVGDVLPDIVAPSHLGDVVDVHSVRADRRAIVIFYRSAVW